MRFPLRVRKYPRARADGRCGAPPRGIGPRLARSRASQPPPCHSRRPFPIPSTTPQMPARTTPLSAGTSARPPNPSRIKRPGIPPAPGVRTTDRSMFGALIAALCVVLIVVGMALYAHTRGGGSADNRRGWQDSCRKDDDCVEGLICIPSSPGGSSECLPPPAKGGCTQSSDCEKGYYCDSGGHCKIASIGPVVPPGGLNPPFASLRCASSSDCTGVGSYCRGGVCHAYTGIGPVRLPGGVHLPGGDGFRARSTPPPLPCASGWHRQGGHCVLEPVPPRARPGGWPRVGATAHA